MNGLILSDTQSIADTAETKAKREASAVDVLEHGTQQYIANFMPKALSPNATPETIKYLQTILNDQAATGLASGLRGMALRDDTSDVLAKTSVPILIMSGEEDVLISPQQSQNMHALAKGSQLVIIANAGHLSSLEQSQMWNKNVVKMFYKS